MLNHSYFVAILRQKSLVYFYLFFNYNVVAMHLNFEINMCL